MNEIEIGVEELQCIESWFNEIEYEFYEKCVSENKPIPHPWIDKENRVIAFHNCFFVLRDLGAKKISVIVEDD